MPRPAASFVGVPVAAGAVLIALVALCSAEAPAQPSDAPTFVGSAACGGCHEGEMAAWRSSQHALAMQEATAETVLGDFDDASFTHGGVTSRFFKRDGKFLVATDGPDGKLGEFEIRYTFGVYPLQQYLIAFPDGRIQALGIAWDARPEDQGGQRWFHLYPDRELKAGDPLHWTGIDQTWNFMCAECHSTELRKNYDAAANTYATTWAEINVACEACHGPGSAHVAWGERQQSWLPWGKGGDNGLTVRFDERAGVHWVIDPATGNARRSAPKTGATELETCGICHSRSARIAEGWRPGQQLLDTHVPSLLQPGLFEADGKMLDEVYNYASFRQSRMFMQGVTCSDCHEPHSLQLRAEGNGVCYQCHEQAKYGAVSHHRHAEGSPAAGCPACHMPARTYMMVDRRHDHGFRIPRPDLSARFGVSNACNDCHVDKDAAWAAAAVERWYGPERKGFQTWTEAFAAARDDTAQAGPLLLQLATAPGAPAIARASAFEMLAAHPSPEAAGAVQQGLSDADPLVRLGALRTLRGLPVEQSWPFAHGLLDDPVRGVRLEAASLLAAMPQDQLAPADRERLARAVEDYVAAQRLNADRPEARVNLGNLYAQQGQSGAAEAEYLAARVARSRFRADLRHARATLRRAEPRCRWRAGGARSARAHARRCRAAHDARSQSGAARSGYGSPAGVRARRRARPGQPTLRLRPRRRAQLDRADRRGARRCSRPVRPATRRIATRCSRWPRSTGTPAGWRRPCPGPTGWSLSTRRRARHGRGESARLVS